jgi:hypothetical protein
LNKSGALVDTVAVEGRVRRWNLTDSGRERIRQILGLPAADIEIEHDVGTLEKLVAKIQDGDVENYLDEAVRCLQVSGLRACVVFVWSASIRTIQQRLMAKGAAAATAAVQKHDPKARPIRNIDDFAYVRDATVLLAAKDLGVFDKAEKDTLEEALDLRNRCGHPSNYRPGVKKVSSFLEDVISILF